MSSKRKWLPFLSFQKSCPPESNPSSNQHKLNNAYPQSQKDHNQLATMVFRILWLIIGSFCWSVWYVLQTEQVEMKSSKPLFIPGQ